MSRRPISGVQDEGHFRSSHSTLDILCRSCRLRQFNSFHLGKGLLASTRMQLTKKNINPSATLVPFVKSQKSLATVHVQHALRWGQDKDNGLLINDNSRQMCSKTRYNIITDLRYLQYQYQMSTIPVEQTITILTQ